MNQPPLNPDALEAAERWMQEKSATFGLHWKNAKPIIETYLAAALPEAKAEAWDRGAVTAWERSNPEVNGSNYHWRSSGEPRNPYRKEANDGRD